MTTRNRILAALAACALNLTACSTDNAEDTATHQSSAEATQTTEATESDSEDSGEIVIEHAYGKTVIPGKPERIATVAWANHEVPLALGVVPVGMSKKTWGDDDNNGILPWVEDRLEELGAETPALFDETDGLPFEQIADTNPDVILASYSGLTQEEYEQLSRIAPTVAFPKVAWATTYEEMTRMNAKAMGMEKEGEEYLAKLENIVTETFAKYPDLEGTTFLFTAFGQDNLSSVGFYTTHDTRVQFPSQNGMKLPKVVADESAKTTQFWTQVSPEQIELFDDVELVIAYGSNDAAENAELLKTLQSDPLLGKMPAIAAGKVAFLGSDPVAASANPSPLSIPSTLDNYLKLLDDALKK